MPTVTVLTAARVLAIEAASIVNAAIISGDLILYKQSGAEINLGPVGEAGPIGPTGAQGAAGATGPAADPVEGVNYVPASGAAQTIPNVTSATINRIILTANCAFTFPTAAPGKSFLIKTTQDSVGGRTVTWPISVHWASQTVPSLTPGPNKGDIFSFVCVDGGFWLGMVVGQNFAS